MVSKIFPADELAERTLEFARRIAELPDHGRAAHQGVGEPDAVDNMGFYNALHGVLHHAPAQPRALGRRCTTTSMAVAKLGEDVPDWRGTKLKLAERDTGGGGVSVLAPRAAAAPSRC